LRQDLPNWLKFTRAEGLASALLSFVKLNLNGDDVDIVIETIFQFLKQNASTSTVQQSLNLVWCACVRQNYNLDDS